MADMTREEFSRLVVQYERLVYTICFQLARDAAAAEELALRESGEAEIRTAIEELREPYGPVCRLCLLEEKTPEEAALALGRPVKTIHTQLARGKGLLRKKLERGEGHGRIS